MGAPVTEISGTAVVAAAQLVPRLNAAGLHFAFLDPYNLAAFDFAVVQAFSRLARIDMLVHVSKMDLQRNVWMNVAALHTGYDTFAPGWRAAVNVHQPQKAIRREVFDHWRSLVAGVGVGPSTDMTLITGDQGQHLYWLLLAAKSDLAHRFWKVASDADRQGDMFA